jgi:DNA polymerase III alpha subunit
MKTKLLHRELQYNGVSIVDPQDVNDLLLRGVKPSQIEVTQFNPDIETFNQYFPLESIHEADFSAHIKIDLEWILPTKYLDLDIQEHILSVFSERLKSLQYSPTETELAIARVSLELEEFRKRDLFLVLRSIIYVLDRFQETGQVWGVGRGSSCASYILFLLRLHVVDSIKFQVPLEEFFHD